MKKISFFSFLVMGMGLMINAQTPGKLIIKHEVGVFLGNSEVISDSLPNGQNLDFMNYLHDTKNWVDYSYFGVSTSLCFRGGWEVNARIAVDDSFNPNFMDCKVTYLPFRIWGFTAGIFRQSQYLENFNLFHVQTDVVYFGDLSSNSRQIRIHDRGFSLGALARISFDRLEVEGEIIGGISTSAPVDEFIHQKLIGGNLLRTYHYQTKGTPTLFISPTLSLTHNHKTITGKIFGTGLVLKWYTAAKAIDYERTEMLWTNENATTKSITSDKHIFNQFDLRLAFKWQW